MAGLAQRAAIARRTHDTAAATSVFNLAALLASDCAVPDLARIWCHRLATVALAHDGDPRHALEPIVNLARLQIRAGDGPGAWAVLEALFHAVDTRTDTTIDGLTIPVARLTDTPAARAELRTWLWSVLLATGAHALAIAGQWDEASKRLRRYNGVGARMLDGRQITVIAHVKAGRHDYARALLTATSPGAPWEDAVTACLHLHIPDNSQTDRTVAAWAAFNALGPHDVGLALFRTRLGLSLLDAHSSHPDREQVGQSILSHGASDGYAARDLLTHPGFLRLASSPQIVHLTDLVAQCGLGLGAIPTDQLTMLNNTLEIAESVIRPGHRGKRSSGRLSFR